MKISFTYLRPLFFVIFLFAHTQIIIAQDTSSSKTPMYYELNSSTDSASAIGERPEPIDPDNVKIYTDKSFPISGYIIIAIIFGAISAVAFGSYGKSKEINFKKWNLKNRENLKDNQK